MALSVERLQHDTLDPTNSIVTVLQKAILVANEHKDQRFLDWARRELKGYGTAEADAEYRNLKGQYVALTSDGRTLPIVWEDDDPKMKTRFLTLPLAEIEALVAGEADRFAVTVNVDPRTLTKIDLESGDKIGFSVTRGTIAGFLHSVRQRVLDWTITLTALPQSSQEVRRSMLQVIDRLQVNSWSYPDDSAIAKEMKLSVEDVRGHLGILEREGRIKVNKTMWGHSAGFDDTMRQLFRESLVNESGSSVIQVVGSDLNEPTLKPDVYEHILQVITDVGVSMERHPSVYDGKDEEALRDHFITVLASHFQSATGETFNKKGKTDILIRHERQNVFVAECKFWNGVKGFHSTIDQLLGYLTWRDSKAAIMSFVKNKELTPVLEAIENETPSHGCFVKYQGKKKDGWFMFELHLPGDDGRGVHLSVLVFHFPDVP